MHTESSAEQLIHNYLAGELSSDEETALFERLSSDPALREELSLQRKMHESLQKDLGSVTIPAAVMAGVFSSVGFTPPKPASDPQPSGGVLRRVVAGTAARTYAMLAGSAAIVTFSLAAYVVTRPDSSSEPASVNAAHRTTESSVSQPLVPPSSNALPVASSAAPQKRSLTRVAVAQTVHAPEATHVIANEPIKAYFDIGKFASVDYLTQTKIIGVADAGKIYCSQDAGKSWVLQTSNTTQDLFGVNFFDTAHGIVVGAAGTILHTSNGGRDWERIQSPSEVTLITVRYATQDTVYTCGAHGTVMRSIRGGTDWQQLDRTTDATLFKIVFVDGSNGSVSGERGITFDTHDAGATWHRH